MADGKQFGKQILIGKTSGKPAMVLSTGIFDPSGKLKGVLAQAMTLTELSGNIVSNRIGETGFTFLVDEKGEVIAHPDAEKKSSLFINCNVRHCLRDCRFNFTLAYRPYP